MEWSRVRGRRKEEEGWNCGSSDHVGFLCMWVYRKTALEQEQANSRAYFHIMRLAKDEKDYVTEQMIQSYYIPEQVCVRPL
jgi:tRNA A37 N6-isopentenylltransferase MiaA